jgi:hypothetical protein
MALAASMRAAWASFGASGDPSTAELPRPSFDVRNVMSLVSPAAACRDELRVETPLLVPGGRLTTTARDRRWWSDRGSQ